MDSWLNYLDQTQFLARSGCLMVLAVLVFSFLEVVIPPLPGDTILIGVSSLAAAAGVSPLLLVSSAFLGTFGASVVCYKLGNTLGERLLDSRRFSRLLNAQMLFKIEKWFERYGYWTLLVSRLLPVARSGIVLTAGIVNYDQWRTLMALSVSILVSSTLLVGTGYLLGKGWQQVYRFWQSRYYVLLAVLGGIIVVIGLIRLGRRSNNQ
ncbi:MAG TPA: DedA family protein [Bacillota bacterium]